MQMVPCGLFSGVITIVGNSIGEGNSRRAKTAAMMGVIFQVVICTITVLVVRSFIWQLGLAYTRDMDVVPVFLKIMPAVYICLVVNGVNKGLLASLRALKKQVLATCVLAISLYLFCLPLSYYLGVV